MGRLQGGGTPEQFREPLALLVASPWTPAQGRGGQGAKRSEAAAPAMQAGHRAETRVAPEQLITTQAGEGHLQPPLAGQPGDAPGVEAVDGGLVLAGQEFGQPGAGLLGAQGQGRVVGSEEGCDFRRRLGLIESLAARVVEADGERVQTRRRQGQQGGRIQAGTEKQAHGHVTHHVGGHGLPQGGAGQLNGRLLIVDGRRAV